MLLRYSELTEAQVKFVANGCGSKGSWIKVPNFLYLASCNHHDFLYWRGATEADRKEYDKAFYEWMKVDIKMYSGKWYVKAYYKIWAFTYYKSVRIFGKNAFSYRENYKDEIDLNLEINIAEGK